MKCRIVGVLFNYSVPSGGRSLKNYNVVKILTRLAGQNFRNVLSSTPRESF